jgi:hypothetical protein
MNFYEMWMLLEKDTIVTGKTDPTTMAATWDRLAPQNPAQNLIDTGEMWKLTRSISNSPINRAWIRKVVLDESIPETIVYRERLGKMVKIDDIQGTVTGRISADPDFYCYPKHNLMLAGLGEKSIESHVMISPPPLEYDNEDRAVLASVIVHELRHAMDFHEMGDRMNIDYNKDMGTHFELNMDDYARNILECRAHVDQVKNLVSTLGGGERARKVLREAALSRMMIPELRQSMIELVDLVCTTNESLEPPQEVVSIENHDVEKIVDILEKVCRSFKFKNFVR